MRNRICSWPEFISIQKINRVLAAPPAEHPAKGHPGLFLKARENLWGNIAMGLGNRLAVFQNKLADAITRNHDAGLLLPGQNTRACFVIISAAPVVSSAPCSFPWPCHASRVMPSFMGRTAACPCW